MNSQDGLLKTPLFLKSILYTLQISIIPQK